jgi:phage gpG-like protein
MSISIEVKADGLEVIAKQLAALAQVRRQMILDKLGALTVTQVKRRLTTEKTAPDGTAWPANQEGTSILVRSGMLRDSMHHIVEGSDSVRSGSNLVYARIHQLGGKIVPLNGRVLVFYLGGSLTPVMVKSVTMPARRYLGYSAGNQRQIERRLLQLVAPGFDPPAL